MFFDPKKFPKFSFLIHFIYKISINSKSFHKPTLRGRFRPKIDILGAVNLLAQHLHMPP